MRLTTNRLALVDALTFAVYAIPRRPSVPILSGVLITAGHGSVSVRGFDYEIGTTAELPAEVATDGVACVAGRPLLDYVKKLPKTVTAVTLSVAGERLTVSAGSATAGLETMPVEDMPSLPDMPPVVGTVDASTLAQTVARVGIAAGTDETVPALTGINVVTEGGTLRMQATDRYRLTDHTLTWSPVTDGAALDALIPAKTLGYVAKAFGKLAGKVGATVTVSSAVDPDRNGNTAFQCNGYTMITRHLDGGNYPPVASLIPDASAIRTTAEVPAAALIDVVQRVCANADKAWPVFLEFGSEFYADQVIVSVGDESESDGSYASERLSGVTTDGDAVTVALNPAYLVDMVKAAGKVPTVRFGIVEAFKPLVATAEGADGYRHLLMPIRAARSAVVPAKKAEAAAEIAPHAYVAGMATGTRRCAVDGCDRGRTAKIHNVPAEVPAVDQVSAAAEVPAVDQVSAAAEVPAVTGVDVDGVRVAVTRRIDLVAEVPAEVPAVDQVSAAAPSVADLVAAMVAAIRGSASKLTHVHTAGQSATWCAHLVGMMPAGTTSYGSHRLTADRSVTCPACAHLAACNVEACTLCAAITGAAEVPAEAAAEVPAVDQVNADDATAPVVAEAAAEVPAAGSDAVMADRVRALITAGTWSTEIIGPRGARKGVDILTLPAGRLDRETYVAVRDRVTALGGHWAKQARGFAFYPSETDFRNVRSVAGRDRVAAWIAAGTAPVAAAEVPAVDQVSAAPVAVEAAAEVPAVRVTMGDAAPTLPAFTIGEGRQGAPVKGDGIVFWTVCDGGDHGTGAVIATVRAYAPGWKIDTAPLVDAIASAYAVDRSRVSITWARPSNAPRTAVGTVADWSAEVPAEAAAVDQVTGGHDADDRCAVCGEHIADPHAPGCSEGDTDDEAAAETSWVWTGRDESGAAWWLPASAAKTGAVVSAAPVAAEAAAEVPAVDQVSAQHAAPVAAVVVPAEAPRVPAVVPTVPTVSGAVHAATVTVVDRGDVFGYRFHLVAGSTTRALGKLVRQELGRALVQLGGSFTVTAPGGSRTVNVVPADGYEGPQNWAPVLATVAATLGAALAAEAPADALS